MSGSNFEFQSNFKAIIYDFLTFELNQFSSEDAAIFKKHAALSCQNGPNGPKGRIYVGYRPTTVFSYTPFIA